MAAGPGEVMHPADATITNGDLLLRFRVVMQNDVGHIQVQFGEHRTVDRDRKVFFLLTLRGGSVEVDIAVDLFTVGQCLGQQR